MTESASRPTPWGCVVAVGLGLIAVTGFVCTGVGWMVGTSMMPDDPIQPVDDFDPGDEFVEVSVGQLYPDPHGYGVTLELQAADGRVLPMAIGQAEGDAIDRELQGVPLPRPMTHDLMMHLLEALDASLDAVTVRKLQDETFHAALYLQRGDGQQVRVDSRSSDAVALALRAHAPIFVHRDVLAAAAW